MREAPAGRGLLQELAREQEVGAEGPRQGAGLGCLGPPWLHLLLGSDWCKSPDAGDHEVARYRDPLLTSGSGQTDKTE